MWKTLLLFEKRVCGFNVKRGGLENSRGVVHFYNLSPFDQIVVVYELQGVEIYCWKKL